MALENDASYGVVYETPGEISMLKMKKSSTWKVTSTATPITDTNHH